MVLVLGKHISLNVLNSEPVCDSYSRRFIVPGEHDNSDSVFAEIVQSDTGRRLIGSAMTILPARVPSTATVAPLIQPRLRANLSDAA
jgi:hypothetical protein